MQSWVEANKEKKNERLATITGKKKKEKNDRYSLMKISVFQIPSGLNYALWSEPKIIALCPIKQGWDRERFCLCTLLYSFPQAPLKANAFFFCSNPFLLNLDFHYMHVLLKKKEKKKKTLSKLPQLVDQKTFFF